MTGKWTIYLLHNQQEKQAFWVGYAPRRNVTSAWLAPGVHDGRSAADFWFEFLCSLSSGRPVGPNLAAYEQSLELKTFWTDVKPLSWGF